MVLQHPLGTPPPSGSQGGVHFFLNFLNVKFRILAGLIHFPRSKYLESRAL